jgi:hypothetical protein
VAEAGLLQSPQERLANDAALMPDSRFLVPERENATDFANQEPGIRHQDRRSSVLDYGFAKALGCKPRQVEFANRKGYSFVPSLNPD